MIVSRRVISSTKGGFNWNLILKSEAELGPKLICAELSTDGGISPPDMGRQIQDIALLVGAGEGEVGVTLSSKLINMLCKRNLA